MSVNKTEVDSNTQYSGKEDVPLEENNSLKPSLIEIYPSSSQLEESRALHIRKKRYFESLTPSKDELVRDVDKFLKSSKSDLYRILKSVRSHVSSNANIWHDQTFMTELVDLRDKLADILEKEQTRLLDKKKKIMSQEVFDPI